MVNTVNKVSYIATWDASQLSKGVMTSRQMFTAQKKILEESQTPLQRYTNGLENLRMISAKYPAVLARQKDIQAELNRQYLQAEERVRKLTAAEQRRLDVLGGASNKRAMAAGGHFESTYPAAKSDGGMGFGGGLMAGRMAGKLGGMSGSAMVGGAAAGGAVLAIGAVGKAIGTATTRFAAFERDLAGLEVFTGSIEGAEKLTDSLRNLSKQSGASVSSMQAAAATMMSYGVTSDSVAKKMEQMAAITRGDQERMRSLALALGQVQGAGRLMGQELLQMINAGFNPLAEISRTTGRNMLDLKKDMEAGKISIDAVSGAFDSATSAGGRYEHMLATLGDTTSVQISKATAAWQEFEIELGKTFAPGRNLFEKGKAWVGNSLTANLKQGNKAAGEFGKFNLSGGSKSDKIQSRIDAAMTSTSTFQSGDLFGLAQESKRLDEMIAKFDKLNAKFKEARKPGTLPEVMKPKGLSEPQKGANKQIAELEIELGLRDRIHDELRAQRKELLAAGVDQERVAKLVELTRQKEAKGITDKIRLMEIELGVRNKLDEQRKELQAGGASASEVQRFQMLEKQLKMKEDSERRSQKMDSLRDSGKSMGASIDNRASMSDATMQLSDALAPLMMQAQLGNITQDQFMMGKQQAIEASKPQNNAAKQAERPEATRVGSQEAYKYLIGKGTDRIKDSANIKQQVDILKAIQKGQERANEMLRQARDDSGGFFSVDG